MKGGILECQLVKVSWIFAPGWSFLMYPTTVKSAYFIGLPVGAERSLCFAVRLCINLVLSVKMLKIACCHEHSLCQFRWLSNDTPFDPEAWIVGSIDVSKVHTISWISAFSSYICSRNIVTFIYLLYTKWKFTVFEFFTSQMLFCFVLFD